jgi:light-regulated signal transduction histidine kinase (bacteriophytochrome)
VRIPPELGDDRELEDARRELAELAYAVSHDVRAPLRVIDGFSAALLEEHGDALPPDALEYLATIRSAVSRMDRLFEAVLQLSRVSQAPLRIGPVDVTALATAVAEELREGDRGRDVRFEIAPDLVVSADAALLRIAVTHLLQNAWKFTARREGAVISVGRASGPNAALFVRDNGAGFDPTTAQRMFGPFQRFHAASEFDGLGIGLALVKRIVHRHGGRVRAEGAPQQGMTVYMDFA